MGEEKLTIYRKKRNFSATREPRGKVGPRKREGLKYALQRHLARAEHYDLRLEWKGVAVSWAIPKGPSFCVSEKRLAVKVEDHPLEYMQFEGTIPKGEYGGGTVMLFDEGEWIPRGDPEKGLKEGSLKFTLKGKRLKGDWALVRMKKAENPDSWLLIKEKDEYAKPEAGISFRTSVRSGKSLSQIAREGEKNPFAEVSPMLPVPCLSLPEGDWLYELKYDGFRTLGFCEGGKALLKTRNRLDCTKSFPAAAKALEELFSRRAAVVDGEMTAADENGIPDFGALQNLLKSADKSGLCYVLFDLLALDGEDLRELPLVKRKEKLKALLKDPPQILSYSEHTAHMSEKDLQTLRARKIEGVVCKRPDSPYRAGKNKDWQKLKFRNTQEFVVGGYTLSENGELSSLLLGFFEGERLLYAGRAGTGFSEKSRASLKEELKKIPSDCPFSPSFKLKGGFFTKPLLCAQIEFAELTSSNKLRQASFQGIRRDKSPLEVTAEQSRKETAENSSPSLLGVKLSHPEKIMFPNLSITKFSLASYYAQVSKRMFPYVKERILSLVCCPSGIGNESFFFKHLPKGLKGIGSLPSSNGDEFYLKEESGFISSVQYNAVEFHIRGNKLKNLPDTMVFDLDPDEALPLREVRRGARILKELLDKLSLVSFLKTSGGKGYHILVPFRRGTNAETFKEFSKNIALLLERTHPDLFTSVMSKKLRGGKIFLDWQRNSPHATSVAPYSVRAREGAPVSMPISWEDLGRTAPAGVSMKAALKRLEKEDPWKEYFSAKEKQSLKRISARNGRIFPV